MYFISFERAWEMSLDAQPFLPSWDGPTGGSPVRVDGVRALVESGCCDAVLLDAYGVLHVGNGLFEQAIALGEFLTDIGFPYAVVTNDVASSTEQIAARLSNLGFPISPDNVISGRSVLADALAGENGGDGFAVLASSAEDLIGRFPRLRSGTFNPADLDGASGFILVDTNTWSDERPGALLAESLQKNPRPLIVCNPDITCPYKGAFSYEPGAFAFPFVQHQPQVPVTFLGKPWPGVYKRAKARFNDIDPARVLAVGDTPQTDILGGANAGFKTLLVGSGLLENRDLTQYCREVGIFPDYVADWV